MTTLACWIGVDSHGSSSVYLASDSRISWNGGAHKWDFGRKLFAARTLPDAIGYCGDVLFPSQILGQLTELMDAGLLFRASDDPDTRRDKVMRAMRASLEQYPDAYQQGFSLLYCTRSGERMKSVFHASVIACISPTKWRAQWIVLPNESDLLAALGSGAAHVFHQRERWNVAQSERTSRAMFSALCDAIDSRRDPLSGGAPQLVGIYRVGTARPLGVIHQERRFLYGLPFEVTDAGNAIEWRNPLFERCDFTTMRPLDEAQRHARPTSLG